MSELSQEMIESAAEIVAATGHKEVQNISSPEEMGISIPEGGLLAEAPVEISPEEEAAMKFTKLLPYVSKLSDAMPSKGGLVRVMSAMAEFPLGARKPRLLNESERQLFAVMQELNGYKSTVLQSFIKKQAELEQMQQLAAQAAAETEKTDGGQ